MPDSSNTGFAEFAAHALDAYQQNIQRSPDPGESTSPEDLVSDLLADLMHYCDLRGADFDEALEAARRAFTSERTDEDTYSIGSSVQLTDAAIDMPSRGTVTGLVIPFDGPTEYYVRFPGQNRSHPFTTDDLVLTPPFSPVPTHQGISGSPLAAEQALIDAAARLGAADNRQVPARYDDIEDHQALLAALSSWSGLTEEHLTTLLQPKFSAATRQLEDALDPWEDAVPGIAPSSPLTNPAHLAAESFPVSATSPALDAPPPEHHRHDVPGPNRGASLSR